MKTIQEIKDFVTTRIKFTEGKDINSKLENDNGILLHFIPESLIDTSTKTIDWSDDGQKFKIKYAFRRFSDSDTSYTDKGDLIEGYTPHWKFFNCFQNGIVEAYRAKVETKNQFGSQADYVKIDNLFYTIKDFIDAAKKLHTEVYRSNPPYLIFISILGIGGTYFYSLDARYQTLVPFPAKNLRFEPFNLIDLQQPIMTEIVSGVNQNIRIAAEWNWQS